MILRIEPSLLAESQSSCAFQRCFVPSSSGTQYQRRRLRPPVAAKGDNDLLSKLETEVKGSEEESTGSKGFGAQQKPKKRQKPSEKPFQIELPQGNEETPAQQLEGNTVRLLAAIFVLFFVEGILLAIAGFLPPAWDDFITAYIYPSFSPTLGVFLAISVVYGLVKSRQGGS